MLPNIVVKVNRRVLDSIAARKRPVVTLPANTHWNRKLKNPATGRFYSSLRVIVRSYEKEPRFVISARSGPITQNGEGYEVELTDIHILLPPFNHKMINEPRRNSIR